MRSFSFADGKSDKFWEITLQGSKFTVRFGKTGTGGQTQVKEFPTAAAAQKEHDKLVAEKVKKGYQEAAAAPPVSGLRDSMEAAIREDFEDVASHMAYADYLAEQGDPRGEFIQVQLALEDPQCKGQRRQALQAREKAILKAHERGWLGELAAAFLDQKFTPYQRQLGTRGNVRSWRRGWLAGVRFWDTDVATLRALLCLPAARALADLNLGEVGYSSDALLPEEEKAAAADPEYPCLYLLRRAAFLPTLTRLSVGEDWALEGDYLNCRSNASGLVELVARTPRLRELLVYAADFEYADLFKLKTLTRLETLHLYHVREVVPFATLARNPNFAALRTLKVRPGHSWDAPGYLPLASVAELFKANHLPALTHLHLYASSMGDEGCDRLVRSGLLKQLRTLELRFGCVTDAGARTLAASPDIRHLHYLSLANNHLTEEGETILERLGLTLLDLGRQAEPGTTDYLMTGDME